MIRTRKNGRNVTALVASSVLHVLVLSFLVSREARHFPLPEPEVRPMDVRVAPMPPIKFVPVVPLVAPPKTAPTPKVQPPKPPPTPKPPEPAPTPPRPTPEPPKPVPPKVAPPKLAALPAPTAPAPRQLPKPAVQTPAASTAPSPPAPPNKLNIHKPEKKAPAGVATLPMAPASAPAPAGAPGAPGAAGAPSPPAAGGSRLSGLSPYPYGAMPSGGPGLRGTLVGCANASAVGLSSVERAHCNERFGVAADKAPVLDGIPPAKRAAFEQASARQEYQRKKSTAQSMSKDDLTSVAAPLNPGGGTVNGPASSFSH